MGQHAKRSSFALETWVLLKRMTVVAMRDPSVYAGRMLMISLTCILFSIIYINARETVQEQALARHWLQAWHCGIASLMSMIYCIPVAIEFVFVKREVRARSYRFRS